MPQKSLTADRSSLLARSDTGLNLGGGNDAHLPFSVGGYDLRGLIGFTFPAGFWDDVKKLTLAELLLTNSAGSGTHLGRGASASALIRRITTSWSPNSAGESWTTAPTVYPGPSVTTASGVTASLNQAGNGQRAVDITGIVMAWAPASVLGPTGLPGSGAVAHGVALHETGGSAQAGEVYSAKHGTASQRPILRLTYESNSPPDAPTIVEPIGPDQVANFFEAQTADKESDPITAYDLVVSTDPSFSTVTHWTVTNGTAGITGYRIRVAYGGTALVTGTRYYWRIRARDAGGFGLWSQIATFTKAAPGAAADAYDLWMAAILEDMAPGRTAIELGTIRPVGEEVAQLLAVDFGELFRVMFDETVPVLDLGVYMLGQKVVVTQDGWEVDAVVELTEPIEPIVPPTE